MSYVLDWSSPDRAHRFVVESSFPVRPDTVFSLKHASMSTSQDQETNKHLSKKLRTACDICHQAKMKCSGGTPCQGCRGSDHDCIYSVSKRIGRPKGTKNKRTADRMNRQQSERERKTHKNERESQVPASTPSPGLISRAQTQPLAFDNSTGQQPATMGNISIDTLLEGAAHIPYSLPSSEGRGLFADNINRWYDFGDLAEISPLKSSLTSSFEPIRSFPNDSRSQYPHNDSAYVSPGSVFGEMRTVALASVSPNDMNLTPSAPSPCLFPSPEYNFFPTMRDFPAASETSSRGVLSHDSILSFPPRSRLSYPG